MNFLTKVAQILAKGLQIIGIFQPVVDLEAPKAGGVVQTVSNDLSDVFNAILDAEKIGQANALTGPQKLTTAIPLVGDIILNSAALANHKVANPTLYQQGLKKLTDGAADIVNSLDANRVVATSKSA